MTMLCPRTMIPFLAVCTLLFSCTRKDEPRVDLVTFALRGEVVGIDTAKMRVTIAHEEIPNYMMAMTMPFKVKDRALLESVAVGDTVAGTLAVSRTESWLETLHVVGKGDNPDVLTAGEVRLRRLFQPGEMFPDETLVNQEGRRIRFSDFHGKVLALTFIYTRCPLPDFCILMSDHFAKLQKELTRDHSLDGTWHLLTISFDPKFDTPRVLKQYGQNYGADFRTWGFATDPDTTMPAVFRIANGLGLALAEDDGLIAHNLRTVLIGRDGRLVKVIPGNEWTPSEIAQEIRSLVR